MIHPRQATLFILFIGLLAFQVPSAKGQIHKGAVVKDSLSRHRETTITGHMVTDKIITIEYQTMTGNNPLKNKDWIAIWQADQILYHTRPLRRVYVSGTTSSGDLAFDSLELQKKEYILGYGSGDSTSTVSATLYFKADSRLYEAGVPFSTQVTVLEHGNNYVVMGFKTPAGNIPAKNKNWIGLWNGRNFNKDESNLILKQDVNAVTCCDAIAFNNLNLVRNAWYTVTYSTGASISEIIATYTFKNY